MLTNIGLLILGLIGLWFGASWFIKGASIIAKKLGVSPLIVGLTLGAIGTSLPELFISSIAAVMGKTSISIGNVVGSNLANIGLALGLGSLVFPVPVEKDVIKFDYWVLLGASLIFFLFIRNLKIGTVEGIMLLVLFGAYVIFVAARHYFEKFKSEVKKESDIALFQGILLFIVGVAGVILGAKLVVNSAIKMASFWGLSETVIGITIVAVGTSLPEIGVVIAGSLKKEPEISLGTIIGSNVINILLILGVASVIQPITILKSELLFQGPAIVAITLILFPVIITGRVIKRYEGLALFTLYMLYIFALPK